MNIQDLQKPENVKKLMDAISEIAEKVDVSVVTTAPNGNTTARKGKIVEYDNSGTITTWINTDAGTTWKQIDVNTVSTYEVGSFTRDTSLASGTQEVTGLSGEPKALIFFPIQDGTDEAGWGIDDGTTARGFGNNQFTTYNTITNTDSIVDIENGIGTSYRGKVTAKASGSFTITWVKAGSPTGTLVINYLAIY